MRDVMPFNETMTLDVAGKSGGSRIIDGAMDLRGERAGSFQGLSRRPAPSLRLTAQTYPSPRLSSGRAALHASLGSSHSVLTMISQVGSSCFCAHRPS